MTPEEKTKRLEELLIQVAPNHIREYKYRDKEGTYWLVDPDGFVWYDAYYKRETFEEALEALLTHYETHPHLNKNSEKKKESIELSIQKLKAENEALKAKVMELELLAKKAS